MKLLIILTNNKADARFRDSFNTPLRRLVQSFKFTYQNLHYNRE